MEEEEGRRRKKSGKRVEGVLFEVGNKYELIKIIGEGSYGKVCSAKNVDTNEDVAIKKISNPFDKSTFTTVQILREIMISRYLNNHPLFVGLKDIMIPLQFNPDEYLLNQQQHKKKKKKIYFTDIYLVYGLADTDLDQLIRSKQELNIEFHYIFAQLLVGLEYLQTVNILHRDLKPRNLLINVNLFLRICDFGFSCVLRQEDDDEMKPNVGTRRYKAPELLLGCRSYDNSVDMWSAGCIFGALLKGEAIFPVTKTKTQQLEQIISMLGAPTDDDDLGFIDNEEGRNLIKTLSADNQSLPTVPFSDRFPNVDQSAIDLLKRMLTFNPRKRISVKEALQHECITKDVEDWKDWFEKFVHKPTDQLHDVDDDIDDETIRDLMWTEMQEFQLEKSESNRR